MLQCHECGADITPGEAARRDVVIGTSAANAPGGSHTAVQRASVPLCPKCVPIIDERLRQESRSDRLWIACILGAFLAFMGGGYFFVVKPNMEKHEQRRRQMDEDFEKSRQKHFGGPPAGDPPAN